MKKIVLGKTGIEVTELCFGALPIGPLQKKLGVDEGAEVIAYALKSGINFIDTAQMYKTYDMIKKALEITGEKPIISTKSAAATYDDMEKAIHEALDKLGVDKIDIVLLHAARVGDDLFDTRAGAWQCLKDYKQKGIIRAAGISTHNVKTVLKAAERNDTDVVFPLINKSGLGVLDGSLADMENAVRKCFEKGIGVFFMKLLAGGSLIKDFSDAFEYGKKISENRAAFAVGMVSKDEVDMNVKFINGENIDRELKNIASCDGGKAFFVFTALCKKCGVCIEHCHSSAISMKDAAEIDPEKCLRCGYCVNECKEFAIRMV